MSIALRRCGETTMLLHRHFLMSSILAAAVGCHNDGNPFERTSAAATNDNAPQGMQAGAQQAPPPPGTTQPPPGATPPPPGAPIDTANPNSPKPNPAPAPNDPYGNGSNGPGSGSGSGSSTGPGGGTRIPGDAGVPGNDAGTPARDAGSMSSDAR
jgi:hypothetical protein